MGYYHPASGCAGCASSLVIEMSVLAFFILLFDFWHLAIFLRVTAAHWQGYFARNRGVARGPWWQTHGQGFKLCFVYLLEMLCLLVERDI